MKASRWITPGSKSQKPAREITITTRGIKKPSPLLGFDGPIIQIVLQDRYGEDKLNITCSRDEAFKLASQIMMAAGQLSGDALPETVTVKPGASNQEIAKACSINSFIMAADMAAANGSRVVYNAQDKMATIIHPNGHTDEISHS